MIEAEPTLNVREMELGDVDLRINYFHDASDDHLLIMGVDRERLPTPDAWRAFYAEDYARPIEERLNFSLVWEHDGEPIGFGSTDQIAFGEHAFMHLQMVDPSRRHIGLGAQFVARSIPIYFERLHLQRLFCEPNAFNVAPNRTLQRVGFRYLLTHENTPGPLNFPQTTTRWVLEPPVS